MRLYYEVALRSFRRAAIYRGAYIGGMITNACFGAIFCFVYRAFYGAGGVVAGFTLNDMISYTWTTQALISVGAGWIPGDIATTIRTGDIVTDLGRPWNFYGYWLSRTLGERGFSLLVRGSLTYGVGVVTFGARLPAPEAALAFLAAIVLAILVSFAFGFVVNLSAFWLVDITGVMLIANIVSGFFSGFLLPLAFLPPALAAIARALPFQAITALPVQIFLGQIAGPQIVGALLIQLFWVAAMTLLALLVLRVAVRKVVIQGG